MSSVLRRPSEFSMFSLIGYGAAPDRFMDFLPQLLLRRLAFEDFQRGSKHAGLCWDTQLLPKPFNLLFFFLGDRDSTHYECPFAGVWPHFLLRSRRRSRRVGLTFSRAVPPQICRPSSRPQSSPDLVAPRSVATGFLSGLPDRLPFLWSVFRLNPESR